jgi:CheY-like chemotaxis protein
MVTDGPDMTAPLILVVDDDGEVLRLLCGALRSRGYRVESAANGRDGIELVKKEVPRLVILDYWMPVLDGAGFMSELRLLLTRRPPVILFTAVHDKPDLARALGVDVYVEKPVQMTRFMKLVEAILRGATQPIAMPASTRGSERRRRPRLTFRRIVEVRLANHVQISAAFTIDISEGGICIDLGTPMELRVDSPVSVAWRTPEGRDVRVDGKVRYSAGNRVGLQFLPLDQPSQAAVESLLAEAGALGVQVA